MPLAIEAGTTEAPASPPARQPASPPARQREPKALAKLRDNINQELALRETGRVREEIHLSGGFHVLMADLSGNRIIAEQVRLLVAHTSLIVNLFENQAGLAGWHDHHDDLIGHCEAGRIEDARPYYSNWKKAWRWIADAP